MAIGKGTMMLSKQPLIFVSNVLHVPKIAKTPISTNSITEQEYEGRINQDLHILKNEKILLTAQK